MKQMSIWKLALVAASFLLLARVGQAVPVVEQLSSLTVTCSLEGEGPTGKAVSSGEVDGCSDGVRGTETLGIADLRLDTQISLEFAVGNLDCPGPSSVMFPSSGSFTICREADNDGGRDTVVEYELSFDQGVELMFDIEILSGLVLGNVLTVNGVLVEGSGQIAAEGTDFNVTSFVPGEATEQLVGAITIRAATPISVPEPSSIPELSLLLLGLAALVLVPKRIEHESM